MFRFLLRLYKKDKERKKKNESMNVGVLKVITL